jgi:hypothetical protein
MRLSLGFQEHFSRNPECFFSMNSKSPMHSAGTPKSTDGDSPFFRVSGKSRTIRKLSKCPYNRLLGQVVIHPSPRKRAFSRLRQLLRNRPMLNHGRCIPRASNFSSLEGSKLRPDHASCQWRRLPSG